MDRIVYDDGRAGVAIAMLRCDTRLGLAIRWLPGFEYTRSDGSKVESPTWMGGQTGWFVLPFDFATVVGKALIVKKAAGLEGFDEAGFVAMVKWLVELDAVSDAMCY